mmetsp:Transcript_3502/g.5971  ORF Transcript_3502/g.5971 Transcript_3502/m.5971 type:complete len:669 (+) Transcript_3502:853-2859(+)
MTTTSQRHLHCGDCKSLEEHCSEQAVLTRLRYPCPEGSVKQPNPSSGGLGGGKQPLFNLHSRKELGEEEPSQEQTEFCMSPLKTEGGEREQKQEEALVSPPVASESTSKQEKLKAALRAKERNEKYLLQLAQKKASKQGEGELRQKKQEEQRQRVREQVAKKNAEVLRLRQEEKEREEQKRSEDLLEKEQEKQIEGPSQEFLSRMMKSSKAKQPPITDWNVYLKRHGLGSKDRIFICSNAYQPLIQELERRGWHRNKDRKSSLFHLKYVILESESSMMEDLKPFQMVNHFLKNNLIVTKVGLQQSLKNLVWWSTIPQDQFFPKCYNLTDLKELQEFKEDFRVNRAEAILKKYLLKRECPQLERLFVALHVSEKRLMDVDQYIDDPDLENLVNDSEWRLIEKAALTPQDTLDALKQTPWYRKIHQKYQHLCQGPLIDKAPAQESDCEPIDEESNEDDEDEEDLPCEAEAELNEDLLADEPKPLEENKQLELPCEQVQPARVGRGESGEAFREVEGRKCQYRALFEYVEETCARLKAKYSQFNMNGTENLWLLKPGSSSRGRGIKVYKSYEKVCNRIRALYGNTRLWVVQKCIENPLIVQDRKFDIRQWVLVTDWNPLTVWVYRDSYVRFCVQRYDAKSESRKNHLTNNSVQKKYADFKDSEIDGNMWSS